MFEENKPIEIEVDNSSHNTSLIEEITKNTFDKVYVPSYQEIMSQPQEERRKTTSEYARIKGYVTSSDNASSYWTRSIFDLTCKSAYILDIGDIALACHSEPMKNSLAVRPMMTINK